MKKSILITGGLGYVGSSLAKHFSEQGLFNVILSSRKSEKLPDELKGCSIVNIDNDSTNEDITDILKNIHIVIHLAALNEIDSLQKPDEAILVNVLGLHKILNASVEAGVNKFIYFSTAHIYCSPLIGNITENLCPIPTHPYAITHRAAEDFVIAATINDKIDGLVLRLSNSIGPPIHSGVNRWTLLVNDICKQIVETGEISLRTTGIQIRNFITMDDLCRATDHFCNLISFDKFHPVYNLGGPSDLSINEMVQYIINVCEKKYGFTPKINKPDTIENKYDLKYDSTKLGKTGFKWNNDIEKEIEKTLISAFNHFKI